MASSVTGLFCAFLYLFICLASKCEGQVNAKAGEDVVLQCQAPREAAIGLVKWTRPDLKSEGDVFFYRKDNSNKKYQHPSFHDRVALMDPEMKDGDASVILKNVTVNDNGTYECRIIIISNSGSTGPTEPQLIISTNLTVTDSGHTPGNIRVGGDTRGHYVLFVPVIGVIVVVFGMFLRRKFQNSNLSSDKELQPSSTGLKCLRSCPVVSSDPGSCI